MGGPRLPMRTTRSRRSGRHRSPHQLSVPSDAPALVFAVPGSSNPVSDEIAAGIMEAASQSCPGVTVRAGYLDGDEELLSHVLTECHSHEGLPAAVVVPLAICAQPVMETAVTTAVSAAMVPVLRSPALGVHPLLASALHTRLAEAGLARTDRTGRISIVTAAEGVLVAADGVGAMAAAGTMAVLLASRLTVPVAAAELSNSDSIAEAVTRLRDAGVSGLALAPCVIGPELDHLDLAALATEAGLRTAQPLGVHSAVGQLAAMRYGAALQDPQLAGLPG